MVLPCIVVVHMIVNKLISKCTSHYSTRAPNVTIPDRSTTVLLPKDGPANTGKSSLPSVSAGSKVKN